MKGVIGMRRMLCIYLSALFSISCIISIKFSTTITAYALTYGALEYEIVESKTDINEKYIVITGCDKNVDKITIPDEINGLPVRVILGNESEGAFNGCNKLRSITLPNSLRQFGASDNHYLAIKGCSSLEEINVIPSENGYKPDNDDFIYASENGVLLCLYLGKKAQHYSSVVLYPPGKKDALYTTPNNISAVFYNAFTDNPYLETLVFSNDVTLIYSDVIRNCSQLKSITVLGSSPWIFPAFINEPSSFTRVIRGFKDSYISEYADSYGYKFEAIEKGDINGDGTVGVEDAQIALVEYTKTIVGIEGQLNKDQISIADVNNDDTFSVEDAQLILLFYTKKTVTRNDITWDDLLNHLLKAVVLANE